MNIKLYFLINNDLSVCDLMSLNCQVLYLGRKVNRHPCDYIIRKYLATIMIESWPFSDYFLVIYFHIHPIFNLFKFHHSPLSKCSMISGSIENEVQFPQYNIKSLLRIHHPLFSQLHFLLNTFIFILLPISKTFLSINLQMD